MTTSLQATEKDYAELNRLRWIYKTEMIKAIACFTNQEKKDLVKGWKETYPEATYNELMKLVKEPKYRRMTAEWDLDTFENQRMKKKK